MEENVPSYINYVPNESKKSNVSIKMDFSENKETPITLSWYLLIDW